MQSIPILTLSLNTSSPVTAERFVTILNALDFNGQPITGVGESSAGGNAIGVARSDGELGDLIPVDVLGTTVVTAGAAIAKGNAIESSTAGKAITKTTGIAVARALQAAAADGDRIEVLLIAN